MRPQRGAVMKIKKILWPTDFSRNSNAALDYVLSLSKKYDAEIYLLYVAQDLAQNIPWYGELKPPHVDKLREWEIPHAEKKMETICEKDLAGCPMFHKRVVLGDPAEEIINLVEKEGIDAIVMATRGRGGVYPFGSVTNKVINKSPVPVWTVPSKGKDD
jgi:nucleotide-binding universal stress UspA family protein